jgi:hypothetical protein
MPCHGLDSEIDFVIAWDRGTEDVMPLHVPPSIKCSVESASSESLATISKLLLHVRIPVRIHPPLPLLCRRRRLCGAVIRIKHEKNKASCDSRCDTIKIPHCSRALGAEHRPKFRSPSPAMVSSP